MLTANIEKFQLGFSEYPTNDWSTNVYFCGCEHNCKGCHNENLWDATGSLYTLDSFISELDKMSKVNKTRCVTLLGGDPIYVKNIDFVRELVYHIKYDYDICVYTGYDLHGVIFSEFPLQHIKYLKTGRYNEYKSRQAKKTSTQLFLGSTNQEMYEIDESGSPILISENGVVTLQ